jgi:hypothetical protein
MRSYCLISTPGTPRILQSAMPPDFDTESCGSDIPYRTENTPKNTTFGVQPTLELETEKRLRRQTIKFSVNDYGSVPRLVGNYSEQEETEGAAFVNALRDNGFTCKKIEEAYNDEFGLSRSAEAIYIKFKIRACDQVRKLSKNEKKRKLSV